MVRVYRVTGLDIDMKDNRGDTTLSWATKGARHDLVRLLKIAARQRRRRATVCSGLVPCLAAPDLGPGVQATARDEEGVVQINRDSPMGRSFCWQPHFQPRLVGQVLQYAGFLRGQEKHAFEDGKELTDSETDTDDVSDGDTDFSDSYYGRHSRRGSGLSSSGSELLTESSMASDDGGWEAAGIDLDAWTF